MTDYTELKRLAEAATQGDWQVIETELPCRIGRPHVERRIFTAKDHPQLKAPYPVINGSVALGTDETPVHHMVSMTAEDAAYIAAANPAAVLALIAENERNQRMVLSACMSMGAIGESLGLDMDSDGDEMLGMVAELKTERDQLKAENEALREEVALDDKLIAGRDRLLNMFECPVHGQCIPYAMEQVEELRKDADRLQSAATFVQKLCDSAGTQPSVATGYLHDILSALGSGEQS